MKYLLLSLILVVGLVGCKEKKNETVDLWERDSTPKWVEKWDSVHNTYTFEGKMEHPVGRVSHTTPIKFSGSGNGKILMKKGEKMKFSPIGAKDQILPISTGNPKWADPWERNLKAIRDTIPKKDTLASYITDESDGYGYLAFDTIGSIFSVLNSPQFELSNIKSTEEISMYFGDELVAYRKKDSAWVFINPDKTIIILDSLYPKNNKQK